MADDAMNEHADGSQTLWGIYVVSAVYGLGALALLWLFFNGTGAGKRAALILGPVCVVLCIGIGVKNNPVRCVLRGLLALALIGDTLLGFYLVGGAVGLVELSETLSPPRQLFRLTARLSAALTMFRYLGRSDVRDAFMPSGENEP